jgi:hypothetical protein
VPRNLHIHAHGHARRPLNALRLSWLRHSVWQRLALVAVLLVPLWLAVLWAIR